MRTFGHWIALALILLPASLRADVVFDVNFNSMTIGLPPTAGGPSEEPSIVTFDPGTECLVVSSYAGLTTQPVYLSDASTSGSAGLFFTLPSPITTGHVRISWRAAAHQIARGGEMSFWGGQGFGGWLCFAEGGKIWVGYGNGQGGQTGSYVGAYFVDQPVTFTVLLNMDAGCFSLSLDNTEVLAQAPFITPGAVLSSVRYGTHTGEPWVGSGTNRYGFDDFRVDHFTPSSRSPASYFPLAVGNHWEYDCQHDVTQPPDRQLFVDITGQTVFGIPGEGQASYRVEYSELIYGHTNPGIYRVTYYSINARGDLGWTAQEFDGNLTVYDSLIVYLRNPITVGDTCRSVGDGYDFTSVVKGYAEPISLLPAFAGEYQALHVEDLLRVGGLPQHREDWHFLPISSWPLAGEVKGYTTHWDSYPGGVRQGAHWLTGASINPYAVGVGPRPPGTEDGLRLGPGLPNPFHRTTSISYELPAPGPVNLEVFDIAGRLVRTLRPGVVEHAGEHRVVWDGRDDGGRALMSGVYLYRLRCGPLSLTRRVVMLK